MPCPVCRAPVAPEFRPFCSRRCADVDLARWFGGAYAIPAEDEDAPEASDLAAAAPTPEGRPPQRR